ncbi:hypothetical protein MHU86_22922 [Fragilaria crotonensis]|nr:hypothetical protein MHU86_22922 [Fragilaria crotonensis]
MTAGVFYTKKQRVQLRKRRQKKRKALLENGDGNDDQPAAATENAKKRKLPVEHEEVPDAAPIEKPSKPLIIIIPADLDAKAVKKFRKDARRKSSTRRIRP